jgi:cytochrome P450
VWEVLKSDPEKHLEPFCEEVLRLEAPAQGLMRRVAVDVEMHGVKIPAGSILNIRYGAANRDERRFDCPNDVDLERDNVRQHTTFGFGAHHCLGAPIARRELYYGFKTLVERLDKMWFIEGANTFQYHSHFLLRALKELHIGFRTA